MTIFSRPGAGAGQIDRTSASSRIGVLLCVAGLGIAHVISFRWHYLGLATFPDDFIGAYHAMAYQWYRDNSFFSVTPWVPYGSYGYPAFLSMQNSAFYWPLQIMKSLSLPYSFENATRLQLIHVFAGSCGMLLFLRSYSRSWLVCFLGAAAYMFSGAFYGNAQHVDTIRSYALFPCVLAVMTRSWLGVFSPAKVALTSLIVSLCLIGGYPGNVIGLVYVLAIFVLFELWDCADWRARVVYVGQAAIAWSIAALASSVKYAEPLMNLGEFQLVSSGSFDFHPKLLLTAILPYLFEPLPNDLSMRSLYLAPFMLIMMFFAPFRAPVARMGLVLILLFVFVTLHDPVWKPLLSVMPGLSFSRNPLADFRPALQLGMVLLAIAALEYWRWSTANGQTRWLRLMAACVALSGILVWGWAIGYPMSDVVAAGISVVAAAAIAALYVYATAPAIRVAALVCAGAAVCGCALLFFNQQQRSWVFSPIRSSLSTAFDWDVNRLDKQLEGHTTSWPHRPERLIYDAGASSLRGNRGYYSQEFVLGGNDIGTRLRRYQSFRKLVHAPDGSHLLAFMARSSAAWVIYDKATASLDDLRGCRDAAACGVGAGDSIVMTAYRADGADYSVRLSKPAFIVENELFFPNWRGEVCRQGACDAPMQARPAGEYLRGWSLPAGTYELRTKYVDPIAPALVALFWTGYAAMLALFAWGLVRLFPTRTRRQSSVR